MNLVIVHHHLNRGGVTQVILNHLRALHEAGAREIFDRVVILYGGRATGWPENVEPALEGVELVEIPSIDYDTVTAVGEEAPFRATSEMLEKQGLSAEETLLHVHNHTLGKNVAWPNALARLAEAGYRMLLQLHDFAEDFRPDNYRRQVEYHGESGTGMAEVYFQAPHVHYAVLNSRDRGILEKAGFASDKLAWLPNPVQPFPVLPHRADARRALQEKLSVGPSEPYVLYPVRGIRRKNVGELVLWSALAPQPVTFGITLAPVNPVELAPYQAWESLAKELELPCKFNVGGDAGLSFHENLAAADAIINTSVAEGFGLVFLEAWLAGKLLIGRDLPEISADFKKAGLRLDSLAACLYIPKRCPISGREVFSEQAYRQRMTELFTQVRRDFGQEEMEAEDLEKQLDERLSDEWIDFALLTVEAQREVVRAVANSKELAEAIVEENALVMRPLMQEDVNFDSTIQINSQIVLSRFGLKGTGERLRERYEQLARQQPGPVSSFNGANRILRQFVELSRFHPVRLEDA
ncbi:hypothetical protein Pan97_47270 [Bremerella volcania]|uniref:Glycosyl transferases group 1 n=1 Tax=Bremerella volcania TaxID=2527984 RepID=A0A518CEQ5_9BACT|nr:hypothetical protein [Bremerella volcania]QDU77654.1 hypothetical protein Pan97_47270 [Bremerella volcania]